MFGPYTLKEAHVLKTMFESLDADRSGSVDVDEFINSPAFQMSHLAASADSMFSAVDVDASGEITLNELFQAYFRFATKKDIDAMTVHVV